MKLYRVRLTEPGLGNYLRRRGLSFQASVMTDVRGQGHLAAKFDQQIQLRHPDPLEAVPS
ncbi:hypothetical protein [Streptomyces halstedii]|uniref:hypothetical protein n=1 Tax=Streptomyces halstedii TaxID=1944 RepID=UPI003D9DF8A2